MLTEGRGDLGEGGLVGVVGIGERDEGEMAGGVVVSVCMEVAFVRVGVVYKTAVRKQLMNSANGLESSWHENTEVGFENS